MPVAAAAITTAPSRREHARVRLCGSDYRTLAWYQGKVVGESGRRAVAQKLGARAVEFRKGDSKKLVSSGFAKTSRSKELIPGRANLSSEWLDTECGAMQVRRGYSGRCVLWLVGDLQAHFG